MRNTNIVHAIVFVLIVANLIDIKGDINGKGIRVKMDDSCFINLINTIAAKHGCRILSANYEDKILSLDGPDDALLACASEIETILGDYTL